MTSLVFVNSVEALPSELATLVVVARQADFAAGWPLLGLGAEAQAFGKRLVVDAQPGGAATQVSLLPEGARARKLVIVALRDSVSRHLSPTQGQEIGNGIRGHLGGKGQSAVIIALQHGGQAEAAARAVARVLPLYDRKTNDGSGNGDVSALLRTSTGDVSEIASLQVVADSTRLCCRLVDMPPAELDTARFEAEARAAVVDLPHVSVDSLVGDALLEAGLRGLHAVGRTAMAAPRLVVLDYAPPSASATIALIGKGLVYDTGGITLKVVDQRSLTMKCDMGGAAAVLSAFIELASANVGVRVVAALAMAENAIGPDAYRPDDVLRMHSGKTVEINNTDAEGRLALADAASYIGRKYSPTTLIDAATLTGAQLVATGKMHAAIVSNDGAFEAMALQAGLDSGDHCLPLLWSPELMKPEFKSKVADMRNSVADRMNAQSAAAAWFVWAHIEDLGLRWLHIDLAGPAFLDNRATGYGIGLIVDCVRSAAKA